MRRSRELATLILDCPSDCFETRESATSHIYSYSKNKKFLISSHLAVILSSRTGNFGSHTTLYLLITILGNLSGTTQIAPARLNLDPAALVASAQDPEVEAAEAETAKALKNAQHVKPSLVQGLAQPSPDQVDVAKDVAGGLASFLSNIDGIMRIADLLADVSNPFHTLR